MQPLVLSDTLKAEVRKNFTHFSRQPEPEGTGLKRAAVAIVLVEDANGIASFLLTRRASKLNAHGGQWALPGGKLDRDESNRIAAARELSEELGLVLCDNTVMGELDAYPTRSGYLITPVVFWGGKIPAISPNPGEVASVHWVNLAELDYQNSPDFYNIPESDSPAIRMLIQNDWIHAPTAALLYQFREVVLKGNLVRVDHLEQPVWAWK